MNASNISTNAGNISTNAANIAVIQHVLHKTNLTLQLMQQTLLIIGIRLQKLLLVMKFGLILMVIVATTAAIDARITSKITELILLKPSVLLTLPVL